MRLVVFHYHDRPGGVRQVISCGLPQLVRRLAGLKDVVLMLGELTDPAWLRDLEKSIPGISFRVVVHRELGYRSGEAQEIGPEARAQIFGEISGKDVLVWAHNLSVGRNVPLLRLLPQWCAVTGARLWLHHHDWWWDGRWARWADWQAAGVSVLAQALELSVPTGPHIRHWCVNQADLPWLQSRAGNAAQWVGNPLPDFSPPDKSQIRQAGEWLRTLGGGRRIWLAPVRGLRRKNLAEAILLAQHQSEPVCIVSTGGPSSPVEIPAWDFLCQAAVAHDWPFVPAVLANAAGNGKASWGIGSPDVPSLPALMAAADGIIMTSLQEGFGLPYLEAAGMGKPLLARALPEVSANMAALGCTLRGTYHSLSVAEESFDAAGESTRLAAQWALLQSTLPGEMLGSLDFPQSTENRDFGSLTLEAQLEVLHCNAPLSLPTPQPVVPDWPAEGRVDHWADRFFWWPSKPDTFLPNHSLLPVGPAPESLLPGVIHRFQYWQQHPLLWPWINAAPRLP